MLQLLFKNPVFRGGEANVTVRLGTKWATLLNMREGEDVGLYSVDAKGQTAQIGTALIDTVAVKTIAELTPSDLVQNHDRGASSIDGLVRILRGVYPGEHVDHNSTVTVITFYPYFSESIHGVSADELEAESIAEHARAQSTQTLTEEQLLAAAQKGAAISNEQAARIAEKLVKEALELGRQMPPHAFSAQELAERGYAAFEATSLYALELAKRHRVVDSLPAMNQTLVGLQLSQAISEAAGGIVAAIDRLTAALSGAAKA